MQTINLSISVPDEQVPALIKLIKQFEPQLEQNLTRIQVCTEFNISPSTLDRWERAKKITSVQPIPLGKKFFKRAEIIALLTVQQKAKAKRTPRKNMFSVMG